MDPASWDLIGFGPQGWGRPLLAATGLTVAVSVAGFLCGLVLGAGLAAVETTGPRGLARLARLYTTIVRSVPELLILYLLFFGGSAVIAAAARLIAGSGYVGAPAFLTGVLALGLISAAYNAEIFRGAWLGVDPGQGQAAAALGLSASRGFVLVILPQLLRLAWPGLGNVWQVTLKESALISLTGLTELMRQSAIAANATARPFLFYAAAAALYLAVTTASARLLALAEGSSRRWALVR